MRACARGGAGLWTRGVYAVGGDRPGLAAASLRRAALLTAESREPVWLCACVLCVLITSHEIMYQPQHACSACTCSSRGRQEATKPFRTRVCGTSSAVPLAGSWRHWAGAHQFIEGLEERGGVGASRQGCGTAGNGGRLVQDCGCPQHAIHDLIPDLAHACHGLAGCALAGRHGPCLFLTRPQPPPPAAALRLCFRRSSRTWAARWARAATSTAT